jgi:hypothetical protein
LSSASRRWQRIRGTYEDFFEHLLALESGLDPALFDWYLKYYDTPVIRYPRVTEPGRVVRDPATGDPLIDTLSVREYLDTLGVGECFKPASSACIPPMQYRAVNVFGFVGYQIGEAILISTGYYLPSRVSHPHPPPTREYDAYYPGALPSRTWRRGVRLTPHTLGRTGDTILATDVNTWRGTFIGKNSLWSLSDLRTAEVQEKVIRDIFDYNFVTVTAELASHGADLEAVLATGPAPLRYSTDPERSRWSVSGLLAAAHLCGAGAVARCLLFGDNAHDEFGASILDYAIEFAGYDTPFGP